MCFLTSPSTKTDAPSDAKRQKILSDELLKSGLPENLQGLSKKKLRKALHKPNKPISNVENPGRGKFEMCTTCKSNARVSKHSEHSRVRFLSVIGMYFYMLMS